MPTKSPAGGLYSVHPGVQMIQDWIATLKAKTGRSLDEWLREIKKTGPKEINSRIDWLKKHHKLGTNSAWWLAGRADGKGEDDTPAGYLKAAAKWVEEMYAGPKAALRPIHDSLLRMGRSLGKDVRVCPCQTIVPFYRKHVFAQIKPSTRTRLDFGLALAKFKGKLPKRLIDTGGTAKKDRITHRFELASPADVDDEVKRWFKTAYELDV